MPIHRLINFSDFYEAACVCVGVCVCDCVMDFNSEKRSGFVGSDMGRSSGSNEGSLGMETTARCALYSTRNTIRYEFNVDSKAEYSALSTTRSQKNKLKQTTPVPL